MKRKLLLFTLIVVLALGTTSFAQNPKPDFSGTWQLDTKQSRLPGMVVNMSADNRLIITHNEPEIKIINMFNSQQGRMMTESEMTLNGEKHKRKGRLGQEMFFWGYWAKNGKDLIIESENTIVYRGRKITKRTKQVFTQSKDGTVITCDQTTSTRDGTITAKLFYIKREEKKK